MRKADSLVFYLEVDWTMRDHQSGIRARCCFGRRVYCPRRRVVDGCFALLSLNATVDRWGDWRKRGRERVREGREGKGVAESWVEILEGRLESDNVSVNSRGYQCVR